MQNKRTNRITNLPKYPQGNRVIQRGVSVWVVCSLILCGTFLNFGTDDNKSVHATEGSFFSQSDTPDTPSISLAIASPKISATGKAGEVITMKNDITIAGSLIDSYSLQISGKSTLEKAGMGGIVNSVMSEVSELSDDTWGYKWDNGDKYKGVTSANTIIETDTVADNAINITKPLVFAAKFSDKAEPGHYETSVDLLLTATPKVLTTYTLIYDAGGSAMGIPDNQSCSTYGEFCNITMPSSVNPVKPGYSFQGWGDTTLVVNSNYGDNKVVRMTEDKIIYAVWKADIGTWDNGVISGATYMQDIKSGFCATSLPNYVSIILKDRRDENPYTIVKMGDGKCWMIENLRIVNKTATSNDSDLLSNESYVIPASNESGFGSYTEAAVYYRDSTKTAYYNWGAATAGTGSSASTGGQRASSSICPKGWRLPGGHIDELYGNEFRKLFLSMGLTISNSSLANAYGGSTDWGTGDLAKAQNMPYNFTYVGYTGNTGFWDSQSSNWWSGTAVGTNSAYTLGLNNTSVLPGTASSANRYGYAIRCIAQY